MRPSESTAWHQLDVQLAAERLHVDLSAGLSTAEAGARLAEQGPNELEDRGRKASWRMLLDQFASTLVVVLIAAAVVSAIVGDFKDAVAVLAIVFLNAFLGFVQEHRAEQAMAALKKLAVPTVRVRRDGQLRELPARQLVPGDIVLLEAGNLIPADGRLIEASNLRIQEAILTGESEASEKSIDALSSAGRADTALGDRSNMAFLGTTVTYGRGQLAVVATGMNTQLGRVADMLQGIDRVATPLQRRLDQLGRQLAVAAGIVVILVFGLGLLIGEDWRLMLMTAISMAVAIVPEGLPAVVTIALALGAQRMLKRQALIRKLPAVETLGSVTVICSDKTGTLTENRMTVTILDLAGHRLDLTEQLRHREPVLLAGDPQDSGQREIRDHPALALLLAGGALCNDAQLEAEPGHAGRYRALGDPTEGALVIAAARFGFWKDRFEKDYPRVAELPFDSERKRMTTLHRVASADSPMPGLAGASDGYIAFTKGSVDGLLSISEVVRDDAGTASLNADWRRRIIEANERMAGQGMRVLGIAFRSWGIEAPASSELEQGLTFIGLVGMLDPPRPEVRQAVATCRAAGIRPVMITGDHPLTARQIAVDLGIGTGGRVLTGHELERASAAELDRIVEEVSIFARVSPAHKLNIVQALQNRGHVVAMTGDGVNDAPALRRADIGVAMGITGTDVSKEAASMVLLDDNFTTIVAAVEEGRAIFDNIRKFIAFSLAGNLGKVLAVLAAPLAGIPLLFSPFQLLYLNLVTDGLLGLGMSVEPAEPGGMDRPPRRPAEGIFAGGLGAQIGWSGILIGLTVLGVAAWAYSTGQEAWQSMAVTTVLFAQVFQALAIRSSRRSAFRTGWFTNPALLGAIGLVVALQLLLIYFEPLRTVLESTPLTPLQLGLSLAAGSLVLWAMEIEKVFRRRKSVASAGRTVMES